jgi:ABC-type bacteriocin/lantibiotic exporter with double-glycine peptidase domain
MRILQLEECLGGSPLDFQLQEGGSNLSGGQQQRLALLRALQVHRPVLILDEATSALDTELRDVVFALLRDRASQGCNVILVTHDREIAERCDDVLELKRPEGSGT